MEANINKNKIIYGNHSKFATNWVCGPNHMLRKQAVPGYGGHIKGIHCENMYSKTFGHTTNQAFDKRHSIGNNLSIREKYIT